MPLLARLCLVAERAGLGLRESRGGARARPTTAGARAQEGPGLCEAGALEQAAEMERQQSAPHAEGGGGAHAGRGRELGMDVAIVLGRRDAGCRV